MNRGDQASEPSMEELLASIRAIISDGDKKGVPERDLSRSASPPDALRNPQSSPFEDFPEEVLDLTDEFLFPDEMPPADAPASSATSASGGSVQDGPSSSDSIMPASGNGTSPMELSAQKNPAERNGSQQQQVTMPSQPLWSRREIPRPAMPQYPASLKQRQETAPSKPQSKSWTEDIQLPIPEDGPVSVVPSGEAERVEPHFTGQRPTSDEIAAAIEASAPAHDFGGEKEAAVAALAEKLVKSAVGALETGELEEAQQVDFAQLDRGRKAEVSEKFAEAIARETEQPEPAPLPTLLNEILSHNFIRGPKPQSEALGETEDEFPEVERSTEEPASERTARNGFQPSLTFRANSDGGTPAAPELAPAVIEKTAAQPTPSFSIAEQHREFEEARAGQREREDRPLPPPLQELSVPPEYAYSSSSQAQRTDVTAEEQTLRVAQPPQTEKPLVKANLQTANPLEPPSLPQAAAVQRAATVQPEAVVQAQFVGASPPPMPGQASRTLEDAVREMLRPMLVQWLNEHMPRILENAIREEIATRGLLPRSDA